MTTTVPENEQRFKYQHTKNGQVRIYYKGKVVTVLSGKEADKFALRIDTTSSEEGQLLMAKATGHFKRGNERTFSKKST